MDIFDLIGPIMVGPSSSHTAGAVRIGLVARRLLGEEPVRAELLLHGSFADTGRGHGTDRALIAGLLGMEPDDSRIPDSFDHAAEHGLKFEFGTCTLREAHPNSVLLRVTGGSGRHVEVVGASIGGGRIQIRQLNGMPLCFSAEQPTLIVNNEDQPGSVADVSRLLADHRDKYCDVSGQSQLARRHGGDGHRVRRNAQRRYRRGYPAYTGHSQRRLRVMDWRGKAQNAKTSPHQC